MNIDNLTLEIRPRNSWRSFDLGCRMALRWYRSLISFWLVVTLPIFVLACAIDIVWGVVAFWWLKPLYERGLLHILSRQVFGETVTAKDAIRAWPRLLKKQWFASITWRRLSPTRGFDLAIQQLEGLDGVARSKRLSILHRTIDDNTAWWTFICLGWELIIIFGLVALISYVVPAGVEFDYWLVITSDNWGTELTFNLFTYLAYLLIAPIYIAGSFAAYLNRRVILEAWDIEIGFKRAINKVTKPALGAVASCILAVMLCFSPVSESWAEDSSAKIELPQFEDNQYSELKDTDPANQQNIEFESEAKIQAILDVPPFNGQQTETDYRWVGWGSDDEAESDSEKTSSDLPSWLVNGLMFFANFSEVLMWLAFGVTLLLLVYLSKDNIKGFFNQSPKQPATDELEMPLFSQAYQGDAMPDDVVSEIDLLFDAKAYRKLMSLMLITSLLEISKEQALPLTKSMTERECLEVIKTSVVGERSEFMQRLVDTWVHLAWAHKWPEKTTMQLLCEQWKTLFADAEVGR
ncbi:MULTISPECIES: hypothetical protein [Aliiglaciecola]|uniref:hypothetical protein n=1 Tax=Aliiglaciecola TaxID=1406885 RepID=UPI001C08EC20|nr:MULTISPECIES: hypothetical protein [Aliiglaciecola]MBU2876050.1 hypothetical protein [Aliiglaciecola lipolytica]MDO6713134.1 hypothetical protein [Aliiglaciecola sp. 2_MG-2023]MDO6754192.1 hypothetical protein [Aliiglaciecola sp. 1_MG-2023]